MSGSHDTARAIAVRLGRRVVSVKLTGAVPLEIWERRASRFRVEGAAPDYEIAIVADDGVTLEALRRAIAAMQGAGAAARTPGGPVVTSEPGRLAIRAPARAFAEPRPAGWPRMINFLLCAAHNAGLGGTEGAPSWLVHGCGVRLPGGGAVIVTGPSGAGKSTFGRLAARLATLLNDEAVLVRASAGDELRVEGTPFMGDLPAAPEGDVLRAVAWLEQGPEAEVTPWDPQEALPWLLTQIFLPAPPFPSAPQLRSAQARRLDGALALVSRTRLFRATFAPTEEAVSRVLDRIQGHREGR